MAGHGSLCSSLPPPLLPTSCSSRSNREAGRRPLKRNKGQADNPPPSTSSIPRYIRLSCRTWLHLNPRDRRPRPRFLPSSRRREKRTRKNWTMAGNDSRPDFEGAAANDPPQHTAPLMPAPQDSSQSADPLVPAHGGDFSDSVCSLASFADLCSTLFLFQNCPVAG